MGALLKTSLTTCAFVALAGCSDGPVSPADHRFEEPAASQPQLARLKPWGAAIEQQRRLLKGLLATSQRDLSPEMRRRNAATIAHVREAIQRLQGDSMSYRMRLQPGKGMRPNFTFIGQPETGGFREDFTATRFDMMEGYYPQFTVETGLTVPAIWVDAETNGSYVKLGQTYPLHRHYTLGTRFFDLSMIGTEVDWPDLWPGFTMVLPILVDCDHVGTEATATSIHQAGWLPIDLPWLEASMTTSGTDDGQCPHVPPVAHLLIEGPAGSARDPSVLNMNLESYEADLTFSADLTERDRPIVDYRWYVNGELIGTGYSISYHMTEPNIGVYLEVQDSDGNLSNASSGVVISVPYTSSGGGGEDDDGDGYICGELWAVWPDGYEMYLGYGCFPVWEM